MTFAIPTVIKIGPHVYGGASPFSLNGVENGRLNPNRKIQTQIAAGQISPSFVYMNSAEPMITATITELGLAIAGGMTPVLGIAGSSGSPAVSTLTAYGTNTLNLGSVAGSGAHMTTTVNLGVSVLKSLKASQGAKATGQVETHAIWDGSNDPFVFSTSASLPASVLIQEEYTLGPCYMNGSALVGVKDVNIETGVSQIKVQSDGNLYPTMTYTATYAPTITITMTNAAALSTFGLIGAALSTGETAIYLEQCANFGTRLATGSGTNHIKITVPASQAYVYASGSNLSADTGDATVVIQPIEGYSSGYIAPLTWSAASNIG